MNIIFDFGNVLVRWEPKKVFLPYFNNDEKEYDFFWEQICDADFRNRIDAGEKQEGVIKEYQTKFPKYADRIAMYWSHWEESLPGEMPGMYDLVAQLKGDPSNHIYGLTNWSMETFPIARQRFKVLQLIDDYVVSGAEGFVKPGTGKLSISGTVGVKGSVTISGADFGKLPASFGMYAKVSATGMRVDTEPLVNPPGTRIHMLTASSTLIWCRV